MRVVINFLVLKGVKKKKNNPALGSIIVGAIMNVINIILFGVLIFSGWVFNSVYLVVGAIAGIVSGVKGIKAGQGIFAIIGIVVNVFAALGSLALTIIYIVA